MPTLKLFTDAACKPEGAPAAPILYPFWGAPAGDPRSPTAGRYERLVREGPSFLELTTLDEADVVVLPAAWEHIAGKPELERHASALAEEAARAGKPLVVFFVSDSTEPVPLPGALVFRTSLERSKRRADEYAMPALAVDVLEHDLGGSLVERPWQDVPVVGFCGYAPGARFPRTPGEVRRAAGRRVRIARGELSDGIYARARALRSLARSPRVELRSIVRTAFWAGAVNGGTEPDYGRMQTARREFVDNLVESDYVLCARGGGNFSYRLYEALSAGRIPLFVDTDCVLPFEDDIDWRALCVWVDSDDVGRIADVVAEEHHSAGPTGFAERLRECRRVWEERLSPLGFFRTLHRCLPLTISR